jgi:hypothetical protein
MGLFPTVIVVAALGELLVVELTDEDVLLNFDDVVEVLEVAALLLQDTSIRDDKMRMQIVNKYNFLFIMIVLLRYTNICR